MPEELLRIFRSHISFILIENMSLIESLLYYGLTNFPSFYLVATCLPGILLSVHEKIQSSISNHAEPFMIYASKTMESILLHIQFISQCYLDISSKQYFHQFQFSNFYEPSSIQSTTKQQSIHDYLNESKLQMISLITIFSSFLKKSLKLHCWKQQFTVNPQLGFQLVSCLTILSKIHPIAMLKCISICTSKDLFALSNSSSPALLSPTSVLGRIQRYLYELKENIQKDLSSVLYGDDTQQIELFNQISRNKKRENNDGKITAELKDENYDDRMENVEVIKKPPGKKIKIDG